VAAVSDRARPRRARYTSTQTTTERGMRPGTTIMLAVLLVVIVGAMVVQLVLAR
jgi:hypothetical protein